MRLPYQQNIAFHLRGAELEGLAAHRTTTLVAERHVKAQLAKCVPTTEGKAFWVTMSNQKSNHIRYGHWFVKQLSAHGATKVDS